MLPSTSPDDPVFFLHHANVATASGSQWQQMHSSSTYLPTSGVPGVGLTNPMWPWTGGTKPQTVTPNNVLSTIRLGYIYDTEIQRTTPFGGPHGDNFDDSLTIQSIPTAVTLYLAPPENAVVLCVDEKSQIQALNRTQKTLPMQPGHAEQRTHDYVRHGPTTLFAALEIATGKITGICKGRHRHQEFLAFLKHVARSYPDRQQHLVMDTTPPTNASRSATGCPRTQDHVHSPPPPGRGSTWSRSGSASSNAKPSAAAASPPCAT